MATIEGLKNRIKAAGGALAGRYIAPEIPDILDDENNIEPVLSDDMVNKTVQSDTNKAVQVNAHEKKPIDAYVQDDDGMADDIVQAVSEEAFAQEQAELDKTRFPRPESPTVEMLSSMHCCGCGACMNSCPVGAIVMHTNNMGFIVPEIDHEKCIECGKCKKACPVINTKYENDPDPKCHVIMADENVRMNSSSGGAFTLLASEVIHDGGYVCGAKMLDDFSVKHVIVDKIDDIPALRGSKYVQSDTGNIFAHVRKLLNDGNKVMFTGCPCQVAGLKNYLGKKYDNLLTVDLICHGGPPQKVFRRYLEDVYGIENLAGFSFRTKEYGDSCYNCVAHMKDGTDIPSNIVTDTFEKTMHSGLALNDLCSDCPFAVAPRQGDITIGDFWSKSELRAQINDFKGISCVLENNGTGKVYIDRIANKAAYHSEMRFEDVKDDNRFKSKMLTPKTSRKWFYNCLDYQPFEKNVVYALKRKYDVGVIGLWYGRNYGSMATYYALHQVLKKIFHLSVVMIENPIGPARGTKGFSKTHPRTIAGQFYDISAKRSIKNLAGLNKVCDTFIVGSDQLWNIGLSRNYKRTYFLDFVNEDKKKISYATSFGKEFKGTSAEKEINSYYLRQFDHVSVRDRLSADIASNQWGVKNVAQTCDPTLLCPFEEYQALVDRASGMTEHDYILAYILDPNPEIGARIEQLSRDKGKKVVVLLDEPPHLFEENVKKLALTGEANVEIKKEVDLYEWMWYYNHADAVVTDSFHGTIFSIVFRKPFLTMVNAKRGAERFTSLLEPLGLIGRLFRDHTAITEHEDVLDGLDYTEAEAALENIRDYSMKWLENALTSEKVYKSKSIYRMKDESEKYTQINR